MVVLGLEVEVLLCRVVVDLVVVLDCVGRVVRVLVVVFDDCVGRLVRVRVSVADCVGRLVRTADRDRVSVVDFVGRFERTVDRVLELVERTRAVVFKALRLLKLVFLEVLYVLRPFM